MNYICDYSCPKCETLLLQTDSSDLEVRSGVSCTNCGIVITHALGDFAVKLGVALDGSLCVEAFRSRL